MSSSLTSHDSRLKDTHKSRSNFRHHASCIWDTRFATLQKTLFIYLINKYISLSDICLTVHHWYKQYRQPTRCNNNGLLIIAGPWPATSWVHYTTSCNTQSSAPEDGQNNCPKHVELTGIINKPLLLHLVDCLYYLYQWCTVKQISDEIYLLIK